MNLLTIIPATLVVLERIHFFCSEPSAASSGATSRAFGMNKDVLIDSHISTLLKNQGVYNALLAVLLVIALALDDYLGALILLGDVLVAAYGSLTGKHGTEKQCL